MTVEAAHEFLKAVPTIERKLHTLLDAGNTIVLIEHNLDVHQGRRLAHRAPE